MARKTKIVTIRDDGRDAGKVFEITEMSATQAEEWGVRAAAVVARAGFDMPAELGMVAVVAAGFQAFLKGPWEDVKPLLAEMMGCVQSVQEKGTRPLVETDIEEIATRIRLRDEVFELHAGFSIAASLLTLGSAASVADPLTSNTPTSPGSSAA